MEVKWVLHLQPSTARRCGSSVKRDVWWKAHVSAVLEEGDSVTGMVEYEPKHGYEAVAMRATFTGYVLEHISKSSKESTIHSWRFYKTSNQIDNERIISVQSDATAPPSALESGALSFSDFRTGTQASCDQANDARRESGRVSLLEIRLDELQKMVGIQGTIFSRVVGSATQSDILADRIFGFLRHKIVQRCQRPLCLPRYRAALREVENDGGRFVGVCYTSALRSTADCTLSDFEVIARVARSRCPNAVFQPSFAETQSPSQVVDGLEILFDSLREMCLCIGLTSHSDLMSLLVKGRKICGWELQEDSAIRILGGTLAENDENKFPFVFRIGGSLHSAIADGKCDVLWRENRHFDGTNLKFTSTLRCITTLISECLQKSGFHSAQNENGAPFDNSVFKLRWSRLSVRHLRNLSKSLWEPVEIRGTIELSWPSLVVRGNRVVPEFRQTVSQKILLKCLTSDKQSP